MFVEPGRKLLRAWMSCTLVAIACTLSLPSFAGQGASLGRVAAAKAAGGVITVVEYYHSGLKHFFITADPAEITALDNGFGGGVWARTGESFPAWDLAGAPADTVPVCRFFGTDKYRADGTRIGPNSHFYDAVPSECEYVKTAWQSIAADGLSYPAWTFEKYAFAVVLPVAGACPSGTQALYRTYNNGAGGDPNHRYSMRSDLLQSMAGWTFEGLVMCLPQVGSAGLPAQFVACASANCSAGTTPGGNGVGLVSLIVDVTNNTTTPQQLVIPPGQTFVATLPVYQNGILLERVQVTIAPATTRKVLVQLFCTNLSREAAKTGAIYTQGPITGSAGLLDLGTIADGKLGVDNDPAAAKASAVQNAVWEVTDGRGSLTAQQRSLLVALLATAADDVIMQADLYQQFQATLSYMK